MSLFTGGIGALSQLTDKIDKFIGDPDSAISSADAVVTSLSQFSKKANIISRAYIDDAVTDDPIVNDTLSIIHQIYTAMILTSINMNQYIENTKVRELLNVIATEEFKSTFQVAQESFNITPTTMAAGSTEPVKAGFKTPDVFKEDPNKFPLGKVVEISLGVAGKQIKTDIFVQIMPIVTPNLVMDELLKLNFTPLLSQRWLQWKAGEISFWRDLIAARDIAKKKRAIRKADKEGIIAEILARQNNAQSKALNNVISNKQARHNIANTVMLFDSQTFKRGCSASSRDF